MTRFIYALMLLGGMAVAPVRAETINCTNITTLPAVISNQGVYCLKQNVSTGITTGDAITIDASNVTLDCNEFKIGGLAAGANTNTYGINAHGVSNITIRNCNIRGFLVGIGLFGQGTDGGYLVEDNRLDGNTMVGMDIQGDGSMIRRNTITANGGSTHYSEPSYTSRGIQAIGDLDVLDNTVWGSLPLQGGVRTIGITITSNDGGSVAHNRVRALGGSNIQAIRIYLGNNRVRVMDNSLAGSGVANSIAVGCEATTGGTSYRNQISGFVTSNSNCHSGGSTLLIP